MIKINSKMAINIILDAAKKYDEKLKDKHFLIIYQEGTQIKNVNVGFRDINFLHLTGVDSKLSAKLFYSACISGRLSAKDFSIDKNGRAVQKLSVLPYLSELLYHNCKIGDFINSGIKIRAEYFVGDTKAVLSVGFRKGKSVDMPVTLYRENIKSLVNPANKVLTIYVKQYNENTYNNCVYMTKGANLSQYCKNINVQARDNDNT